MKKFILLLFFCISTIAFAAQFSISPEDMLVNVFMLDGDLHELVIIF